MTPLANFLLILLGTCAGAALCGLLGTRPDRRSAYTLVAVAVVAAIAAGVLTVVTPRPNCYHPAHVQAVWLDGAWQCITAEEAG
jgi:hypothetical protein